MAFRVGYGIDFHEYQDGLEFYLGSIKLNEDFGCIAHSDGDVLIHAVMDALLGAMGLDDIGELFPDSDEKFRNIRSTELLKEIMNILNDRKYRINNCDITIVAQKPRLSIYKQDIKREMAKLLNIELDSISIKATTPEKMGDIGKNRGICAMATVLIERGSCE